MNQELCGYYAACACGFVDEYEIRDMLKLDGLAQRLALVRAKNHPNKDNTLGLCTPQLISVYSQQSGEKDELDIKARAENFVQFCRQIIGVHGQEAINQHHLQQLVEYYGLAPIAFLHIKNPDDQKRGHWTLVVGKTEAGVEVYNPRQGLVVISKSEIEGIHYFLEGGSKRRALKYFYNHSYALPDAIRKLGILKETSGDCGPLCVFAARLVKGK